MLTKEDLQAIAGLLVPIETRIGNLESRFDNLESRFDKLESRFDNLESRFDSLETRVDNFESETKRRLDVYKRQITGCGTVIVSYQCRAAVCIWSHDSNGFDLLFL